MGGELNNNPISQRQLTNSFQHLQQNNYMPSNMDNDGKLKLKQIICEFELNGSGDGFKINEP